MLIHIAVVERMSGMDTYTATTREDLNKQVAAYCRDKWHTINVDYGGASPSEDDEACIERYFDDHENDSLTTDCDSIDVPLPTENDLIQAMFRVDFIQSLEACCDAAGGNIQWDSIKNKTLDELSGFLPQNGVMFTVLSASRVDDIRSTHRAAAKLALKALPQLQC